MQEKDIDMSQVKDGRGLEREAAANQTSAATYDLVVTINEAETESEHEVKVDSLDRIPEAIGVLTEGRLWTSLVITVSNK